MPLPSNPADDEQLVPSAWTAVGEDPILGTRPAPGSGSTRPAGDDLDLHIGWDRFEQLVLAVSSAVLGVGGIRVRRYGTPGQAQYGIDLAGRDPDRSYTVIQCKEYQTFTPADLRAAVETFADGRRPFRARRFIVATSASAAPTQLNDELADLQDAYPDLELELWGSEQINEHLRYLADVVARFWTWETADNFCTGVRRQGTPAPPTDRRAQAERVLLGPLSTPDVAPLLRDAERSRTEAPARAAELYGNLADRLAEEKFHGGRPATRPSHHSGRRAGRNSFGVGRPADSNRAR
jgi:hypothetical protein